MITDFRDSPDQTQNSLTISINKRLYSVSVQTALLMIMVVAVLSRLVSAIYQGNSVTALPGIYDQISYDGLARRVLSGYGFSFGEGHWPATRAGEPTAHWSYLYTLYLVLTYKVFGISPLVARVIQALVAGSVQTWFIWRIGTRLFGRSVGIIAAFLNAVYIYFFYYAGALITETFYITGILWTIDCALRLASSPVTQKERQVIGWWRWLEFGVAIGFTVLLRQVFLLFVPLLFLWVWWNAQDSDSQAWKRQIHWRAVKGLSLAVLILLLSILPWTIRNYRAFGTFVLLNTNAGFAFFWGNHPIYGTNFIPLLPSEQSYYDLIPVELRRLNEAELDKALLQRGIQFIADDPQRFLLLSMSRAVEFFKFWPSSSSGFISNISRVASFGLSLPFMLYGLWTGLAWAWQTKSAFERQGILLLVLFVLSYAMIHLFSWALIRYRLPIDVMLLMFAAFGIEKLLKSYVPR